MAINFRKMQGTGNNFIVTDNRDGQIRDLIELAKDICNSNYGIGADGLVTIESSDKYDFKMRIINADGSEPEMCGNGIRCFARFVEEEGISSEARLSVDTLAGEIVTELVKLDGQAMVRVNMGSPTFNNKDLSEKIESPEDFKVGAKSYFYVSMGNPHAVRFVEDFQFNYHREGEFVENHTDVFPNRTNVEFNRVLSQNEMEMRVWERGCGETFACGTGACASVVAGISKGLLVRKETKVHLLGGMLFIDWKESGDVIMTGPAESICKGQYLN